jgi:hypothetical protein
MIDPDGFVARSVTLATEIFASNFSKGAVSTIETDCDFVFMR